MDVTVTECNSSLLNLGTCACCIDSIQQRIIFVWSVYQQINHRITRTRVFPSGNLHKLSILQVFHRGIGIMDMCIQKLLMPQRGCVWKRILIMSTLNLLSKSHDNPHPLAFSCVQIKDRYSDILHGLSMYTLYPASWYTLVRLSRTQESICVCRSGYGCFSYQHKVAIDRRIPHFGR